MILYRIAKVACNSALKGKVPLYFNPCRKWTLLSSTTTSSLSTRLHYSKSFRSKSAGKSESVKDYEEQNTVFPTVNEITSEKSNGRIKAVELDEKWTEINTKWHKYPKIYMSLSKWYLTFSVVVTADAGFCLAPVGFDHSLFFFATMGTFLCSCAANSFNQIAEVPYDAQMDRTKNRPLVRNVISPLHATAFALTSATTGVACLYYGVNGLTAALGLANIILYAGIYTPLKRRHWLNTWVGSIVGAVPPIMGWTAATGAFDPGAFILAGILYSWQFPHFYALAWRRRGDYARGSYHMLPLFHPEATKSVVFAHSLSLCLLSLAAPFTGVTSWGFVALSAPFNAWIMLESIKFYRKGNSNSASKLYKCSLYYILAISLAMVVDRKVLTKAKKKLREHASS